LPRFRWGILFLMAVSLACQHGQRDTVNDPFGDGGNATMQNETHIAVRGNVMVVGWNNAGARGWETEYGYSTDGGLKWVDADALPPVSLDKQNVGDPVVAVGSTGDFYFATMVFASNGEYFIGVYRSTQLSPAVRFGNPVLVPGSDLATMQDKPWMAVDPTSGNVYLCWTDTGDLTIKFVRSGPPTPTAPLNFGGLSIMNTPGQAPGQGCNIGVGPSGEVYVTWIAGVGTNAENVETNGQRIYVRKSVDGGNNFGPAAEAAAPDPSGDPGASAACSVDRPNMRALAGNVRLADMPVIAVDRSGGPFNGTVYIAYSGAAGPDRADVFVVRSPADPAAPALGDPGVTWSEPITIHKTPAATQEVDGPDTRSNDNWMPAIAVSSSGTVAVSFYDRRNDAAANMKIDVYAAISRDGGVSWANQRVTSASFGVPRLLPHFRSSAPPCYMGDYNGMAAAGTAFHLVWGDNSRVVNSFNFPDGRPDPDIKYKRLVP